MLHFNEDSGNARTVCKVSDTYADGKVNIDAQYLLLQTYVLPLDDKNVTNK